MDKETGPEPGRDAPDRSRAALLDKRGLFAVVLSGALCALEIMATIPLPRVDGKLIGSDGIRYYAITRSLVLDRDFDYRNDYTLLNEPIHLARTGLVENASGIGTGILWLPFFLIAHVISLVLNALGWHVPTNGIGYLYEASVCLGTIAYGTVGFVLAFKSACRVLVRPIPGARLATLGMLWATPAVYYLIAEPSMSHGISVFAIALFFHWWHPPGREDSAWRWFRLGLAAGLVTLVRPQDGVIALVPVGELAWRVARGQSSVTRGLRDLAVFTSVAAVCESPQLVMWLAIYGTAGTVPQGASWFNWFDLHVLETLFSTRHGLLSWHPLYLFALLGLVPLFRRERATAIAISFVFLAELYVNSAATRWWQDDAFGGRRFVSLVPLLAMPLAVLLERSKSRWAPAALILALTAWNGLAMLQYRLGFVSMHESLTWREMTIDRLLLPVQLLQRLLH